MLTNRERCSNNHLFFEKGSTSSKPWERSLNCFVLSCPQFVIDWGFSINLPILCVVLLAFVNNKALFRIEMRLFILTHLVLRKATTCHKVIRCLITAYKVILKIEAIIIYEEITVVVKNISFFVDIPCYRCISIVLLPLQM